MTRRYTDVNAEFCRSTGFSREEVLGKTYWEIGVWPSREESDNFAAALGRTGEIRNMRADFYSKDGRLIPCLMSGVLLELDGKLSCLTITRNIGDLVAAEQKLQSSEAMLREIFDSNVDNIALTGLSDGIIIDVNNEMVRSVGLAKTEMLASASMISKSGSAPSGSISSRKPCANSARSATSKPPSAPSASALSRR